MGVGEAGGWGGMSGGGVGRGGVGWVGGGEPELILDLPTDLYPGRGKGRGKANHPSMWY